MFGGREQKDKIDAAKDNPEELEAFVEAFLSTGEVPDSNEVGDYPVSRALRYLADHRPSKYFQSVYERLATIGNQQRNSGGYVARTIDESEDPHEDFKLDNLQHWHAKAEAIEKVEDEAYLKKIIAEVPDDCNFGYESPQAIAVRRIEDQSFLEALTVQKKDVCIVEAAIKGITNRDVLDRFANLTDHDCDQQAHGFPSPESTAAFHNGTYRRAARARVQELLDAKREKIDAEAGRYK